PDFAARAGAPGLTGPGLMLRRLDADHTTLFTGALDRSRVVVCLGAVLVFAVVLLAVGIATEDQGKTKFGPTLGADFVEFYVAGDALNHDSSSLYDESA